MVTVRCDNHDSISVYGIRRFQKVNKNENIENCALPSTDAVESSI
jgi:hypothetical protein